MISSGNHDWSLEGSRREKNGALITKHNYCMC